MVEKERIEALVFSVIDAVNEHLDPDEQVTKTLDTRLYGDGGQLDSISVFDLIGLVEQRVRTDFGVTVTLATEKALSNDGNPLRDVQSLVDHLSSLLQPKCT